MENRLARPRDPGRSACQKQVRYTIGAIHPSHGVYPSVDVDCFRIGALSYTKPNEPMCPIWGD
jgi:hypothetical protein